METFCETIEPLIPAVEFWLYTQAAEKWLLLLMMAFPMTVVFWGLIGWGRYELGKYMKSESR